MRAGGRAGGQPGFCWGRAVGGGPSLRRPRLRINPFMDWGAVPGPTSPQAAPKPAPSRPQAALSVAGSLAARTLEREGIWPISTSANEARSRPNSGRSRRADLPNPAIGQIWRPNAAKFGQHLSGLGQHWPGVSDFDQIWPDVDRLGPKRVKIHRHLLGFGRNLVQLV